MALAKFANSLTTGIVLALVWWIMDLIATRMGISTERNIYIAVMVAAMSGAWAGPAPFFRGGPAR